MARRRDQGEEVAAPVSRAQPRAGAGTCAGELERGGFGLRSGGRDHQPTDHADGDSGPVGDAEDPGPGGAGPAPLVR